MDVQLTDLPDPRRTLQALLEDLLGDEYILWLNGERQYDKKGLRRIFVRMFPPVHRGRKSASPPTPPRPPDPPKLEFTFWDGEQKLELGEHDMDLLRRALAERIALMLVMDHEPALATLKLVHWDVDWERVITEGVEVIEPGAEHGNRLQLGSISLPSYL